MSTGAIIMMIIAIAVVWGGLVAAIVRLRSHAPEPEEPPPGARPAE
ncbi:methionine/alanine import family NSS transporter small subunit [Streptomyces peucetius]|uniref:Methionine/alanine import family NSS transporter small subunit n=1 Tax=Streptomyces peucetius TaxID=1950 RepID=A0ABY6I6X2_STRPE|nr:methionine/alanine import family NSS transporter small subunit [Streptomyces peucetius]UYQ61717.1 methionine/alanine import family NSS transporter small subunit [Streptomyces peucetius]